jgi:hypothetical protein
MSKQIIFKFNVNDPLALKTSNVIVNSSTNYVEHAFLQIPIYDVKTNNQIGYKVADDYIQQLTNGLYLVRINSTYYFNNTGTISWQYSFVNTIPSVLYPAGVPAISNVTSTTGQFIVYSNGEVKLIPTADGNRVVFITLNC